MSDDPVKRQKMLKNGLESFVNELQNEKLIVQTNFIDKMDTNSAYSWTFAKASHSSHTNNGSSDYVTSVVSLTDNKLTVMESSNDTEKIEIPLTTGNVNPSSTSGDTGNLILDAIARAASEYAENAHDEEDDHVIDLDDDDSIHGDGVVLKGGQPDFASSTFHNCTINIFDAPYQSQVASTTKPLKLETEETTSRINNNNNNS